MSLWAIVPVKPFLSSKSRLASVLSPRARAGLSREFLSHALEVLAQVPVVSHILVVSRDPAALALARGYRAHATAECGAPELNAALGGATQAAVAGGARAVLILPADLPFLSEEDVRQLVADAASDSLVVIAPDRREEGTNALFVRPPGVIKFGFGDHSFQHHLARAAQAGARVRICRLPGVALDVDVPGDWELYQRYASREVDI